VLGLDLPWDVKHIIHMKRTTLMVDEQLLKEATRASGGTTYSGAVNLALHDFVRRARARKILELAGTGSWEGSLVEMRSDAEPVRRSKR
jgi:Arc/MetJ family transcription regulator